MSGSTRQKQGTRVFIALDPPDVVCSEAEAWARHLARSTQGLRVVPARNSHVTLAFLGQCDEFEIEQITSLIAATLNPADGAGTATVTGLSLGAPAWLPKRRPRNLVIDIHDDRGELVDLQAALARNLRDSLGFRESRPYRPHLTCARTGRGFDPSGLRLPISPSIAFDAVAVTLYASHLSPEGAEYESLASFPAVSGYFRTQ